MAHSVGMEAIRKAAAAQHSTNTPTEMSRWGRLTTATALAPAAAAAACGTMHGVLRLCLCCRCAMLLHGRLKGLLLLLVVPWAHRTAPLHASGASAALRLAIGATGAHAAPECSSSRCLCARLPCCLQGCPPERLMPRDASMLLGLRDNVRCWENGFENDFFTASLRALSSV